MHSESFDILIVEDDPGVSNLLMTLLAGEGWRVKTARGTFEALHFLEGHSLPQLILLDLALGMTQGATFRRLQQENPRLAQVPVVLVSGRDDLQRQAEELGAAGWLAKPLDLRRLLTVVRRFC